MTFINPVELLGLTEFDVESVKREPKTIIVKPSLLVRESSKKRG